VAKVVQVALNLPPSAAAVLAKLVWLPLAAAVVPAVKVVWPPWAATSLPLAAAAVIQAA
jgi:hypothetical protein